jgi:HlyD family secretion protein
VRILAFAGDVELTTNVNVPAFGAVVRSTAREHALQPHEYVALWQLFGAQRRGRMVANGGDVQARVKQTLIGAGLAVEQDAQPVAMAPDHRVALLDGVHLLPAIFEVRDAHKAIRYLGLFEAAIVDACDGTRSVAELDPFVRQHGYEVQLADIAAELDHLRAAGLVQAQGGVFRKRPDLMLRPDAVVVRALWSDLTYLISGDEADVMMRCRDARTAAEIVHELGAATPEDQNWILGALARASMLKLLAHSAPRPSQLQVSGMVIDEDRTTVARMEDALTTGDAMTVVAEDDPRTNVNPAADATPSGAGQMFVRMLPPARPSWPTIMAADSEVQPGPPAMPPGMPPVMPPVRPPSPSPSLGPSPSQPLLPVTRDSRDIEARLASLSLPKGGDASVPIARQAVGGSSKLPWILLVVVVIGFAIYQLTRSPDQPEVAAPPPPPQGSGPQPVQTPATGTLLASGFIAAKTPIVLSAPTGSRINEIAVSSGDKIKKAQIVATLADGQIQAELGLARAKLSDALRQRNRVGQLFKAQAVTPAEFDRAKGQVEIANAEVNVAKQKLEDTRIKSPIDGTVLEVIAHPGEVLAPGPAQVAGVMRIADLTTLVAEVNVNESDLKNIYLGQLAELLIDSRRDQKLKGTVTEIAQQADRAKGTVLVKVDIERTTENALKPGMTIQVRFAPKPPAGP